MKQSPLLGTVCDPETRDHAGSVQAGSSVLILAVVNLLHHSPGHREELESLFTIHILGRCVLHGQFDQRDDTSLT